MKKKVLGICLIGLLLAGCGSQETQKVAEENIETVAEVISEVESETYLFVDDIGREVELPKNIERVVLSGAISQNVFFALAPDKIVATSVTWDAGVEEYIDEKYMDLPVTGQIYSNNPPLDPEILAKVDADVMIDIGESKDGIADDLDKLQMQTGIPCIHISSTLESMPETYRTLGELMQMEAEAEEIAVFCEEMLAEIDAIEALEDAEKKNVLYVLGDAGLNVLAKNSYFMGAMDQIVNNQAVLENPAAKGTGNEVDVEQLLLWNPEIIIFDSGSIYDAVADQIMWQGLDAIANDTYYKIPYGPYKWIGQSSDGYLSLLWAGALLYPEEVTYDLQEEMTRFFKLFYHSDLTEEQYTAFMKDSVLK